MYSPNTLFSGAGGIIIPSWRYLATNFSCKPKKSLNRRITTNSGFLNAGMVVYQIENNGLEIKQIRIKNSAIINYLNLMTKQNQAITLFKITKYINNCM